MSMKKSVKNNQAEFLLGPNLRISHDWSFLKKMELRVFGMVERWKK